MRVLKSQSQMKKRLTRLGALVLGGALMAGTLTTAFPVDIYARHLDGASDWNVTFTAGKVMESNFGKSAFDDVIFGKTTADGLQPGDDMTISLTLTNSYPETTDWYMTNEVLSTLESRSEIAEGGAYSYKLVYNDPNQANPVIIYSSEEVGGEEVAMSREGLREATSNLENYFYLGELKNGQTGTITLDVTLEGETQGNTYQDTLADLQMNFAVELVDHNRKEIERPRPGTPLNQVIYKQRAVKTGDESRPYMLMAVAAVSGVILLIFAILSVRSRRKDEEGGRA